VELLYIIGTASISAQFRFASLGATLLCRAVYTLSCDAHF